MDYLQAFATQVGIKGRLWQTNVFQDGSHETHLVFKVAGFKGMSELGRFSHLLSLLLIWGRAVAPPTSVPAAEWSPLQASWSLFLSKHARGPGVGGLHFLFG